MRRRRRLLPFRCDWSTFGPKTFALLSVTGAPSIRSLRTAEEATVPIVPRTPPTTQPLSWTEADQIERWREHELRAAGYSRIKALTLARRPDIDLHLACDLLRQGCSQRTAVRILL